MQFYLKICQDGNQETARIKIASFGKKTKPPKNSNGNESIRIIPIHFEKLAPSIVAGYCYCDRRTVGVRS
jgi:hypothetical protein